jgi:hypothetical protein
MLLLLLAAAAATHYHTLGLPHDASPAAIKKAYRAAALRTHPDKARGRGAAGKAAAATRMESLNEAYAVLIDPVKRHNYDHSLAYRYSDFRGAPRQYAPRVVKATIECTLEQLGSFEPVEVPLRAAIDLPPSRKLPPMRIFLPPGSASGDSHRVELPHLGAVLELHLRYTVPHRTFSRQVDDLAMTIYLAAWHNRRWWRWGMRLLSRKVRVRALSGGVPRVVCEGDVLVPAGGKRYRLRGLGMPRRAAAAASGSPYGCARGHLLVCIRLRTLKQSLRAYGGAVAAALSCGALLPRVLRRLLPKRRQLVPVLSRWTGPGPGISEPFRMWGKPGLWKYRMEYQPV